MRPIGPGENGRPRPGRGQPGQALRRYRPQWRETARLPSDDYRGRPEIRVWRADARRDGHRPRVQGPWNAGRSRGSRRPRSGRLLRGLSGSLAAGLVVLTLGLVGVQLWQSGQGQPGPEWRVVIGHSVAAVLAVGFQRFADRRRGPVSTLAAVAVFVVVALTLWIWWLN